MNLAVVLNSPHLSASSGHSHILVNGQKSLEPCGHSPDGRQLSPLTSPLLNDAGSVRTDDEDDVRRKRFPTDRAYFIAKELLTTERTYLKDLEVVTVSFQSAVGRDEATPDALKNTILSTFEPLHKFHAGFLREVEQRLSLWEGRSNAHIKGDYQHIGDVLLSNLQGLKPLTANLHKQCEVLLELEKACRASRRLEGLCRDFELQKVCYVPLNVFILRPLHRLSHYQQILERLCKHYPATHGDFRDCRAALADVSEMVEQLQGSLVKMENFQKLLELKKDLIGVDGLVVPGREFIRLGCLSKLSGKGLQQRMFFLNQLSGNLLRKFKNSNGWQKLWVVFTNFSLFFYKSHQDDYPLASLPLLGYSVTIPSESENIHKEYVFKLHFKSHVYYFRSESEYTFERWMEVIRSATVSSSSARVRKDKESHPL
ncbi:FERM, RhoGEF and pleckstrin domain-containing protein 1 [Liparis tanakae]|uniref:FERM, RhoGEF and pleckstrin domain-containing protein 1 n=1 Tax=Liparis tanakae TaxID=230148 RepID=A0A4Z2GMH8_9TELE|nr:FERM, RhoGEF and pleckstrin domain-containing protein 1 [Liparis tanakae]